MMDAPPKSRLYKCQMRLFGVIARIDLRKASSRSLLAGEQADTLGLLRLNDRESRHRRIKKQRRYERLAATSQLSLW